MYIQSMVQDTSNLLFPQNCRIGNSQIRAWQSAVIREAFADTSRRVCKHLTKSSWTPHEESADTSQRARGITEKNLQMKHRKFERLASWELLGLFLSVISDLGNDGLLCDYDTTEHRIPRTEHGHSVVRCTAIYQNSQQNSSEYF